MQPKFVVIDGPRGAGKSTTCELIVGELIRNGIPAEYYKKGMQERVDDDEYTNMVAHIRKFQTAGKVIVCDRFVATEWVMSIYHNRADERILTRECSLIDNRLVEFEIPHVILLPSLLTLTDRLMARGAGGRTWDMDPAAIHSLWRAAHGILKSSKVFPNDNTADRQKILEYVMGFFTKEWQPMATPSLEKVMS